MRPSPLPSPLPSTAPAQLSSTRSSVRPFTSPATPEQPGPAPTRLARAKPIEIDNRTLKLLVGLIAIGLPLLTNALTGGRIGSISESYYYTGPASTLFVGFLFAIASFLCAYNGRSRRQMFWSKVASLAAVLIALFPCNCGRIQGPGVHYAAAAVLFGVLTYFCWTFYQRSLQSTYPQARARRSLYLACGCTLILSNLALALNALGLIDPTHWPQFVFYGEAAGLIAFGISWLVASRTLPMLTHPEERFSPFRAINPVD